MDLDLYTGPLVGGDGLKQGSPVRNARTGELVVSDAHGRFYEAISRGTAFYLSAAAAGPTAYVGAGAGTPLLAVHNPAGSGKNLALLGVALGLRAIATAAGQTALAVWAGVSVLPTGTVTVPRSALSHLQQGSAGIGFVNTALTGSTALNLVLPLATHYWATAASAFFAPAFFDIAGGVVAIPGNQIAVGVTVVPTTLTVDIGMFWEEIPI